MEQENDLIAGIFIPSEEDNPCVRCKHLFAPLYGSPCENCLVEEDGEKKWVHRVERES